MYILQNGKVYIRDGNDLVGVEIYADHIVKLEHTRIPLVGSYESFDDHEMYYKANLGTGGCYIFPQDKEVKKDVPIIPVKKSTRKSTGK